jgi:hypothetical protein
MGKVVAGALVGVLVTPAAVALAVVSAGAGHGHYEFARLFFPFTMLLTRLAGDTITLPFVALALVQFPLYGAVIGLAASKGRIALAVVPLLVVHAVAAALCFSGLIPNFS